MIKLTTPSPEYIRLLIAQLRLPTALGIHQVLFTSGENFSYLQPYLPIQLQNTAIKRQREFLGGRYCASKALAYAGHKKNSEFEIDMMIGEDHLPLWPTGWVGSISHCNLGAIAVVAPSSKCHALGIDMEQIVREEYTAEIEPIIASPQEWAILDKLAPADRLILLFSAKEALYKALYPQIRQFHDFNAARLVAFDNDCLWLCLTLTLGKQWPQGLKIPVRYMLDKQCVYSLVYIEHSKTAA